jgi:hypothetical protein
MLSWCRVNFRGHRCLQFLSLDNVWSFQYGSYIESPSGTPASVIIKLRVYAWMVFTWHVCRCITMYVLFADAHTRKWKKCTKNEEHVATIHGHVCLCSSLFLIKDSNIHILCYKTNLFSIRPFTYIRDRMKIEGYVDDLMTMRHAYTWMIIAIEEFEKSKQVCFSWIVVPV